MWSACQQVCAMALLLATSNGGYEGLYFLSGLGIYEQSANGNSCSGFCLHTWTELHQKQCFV